LATKVAEVRPDLSGEQHELLTWAVIEVVTSPSFHSIQMPRPTFARVMADVLTSVITAPIADVALLRADQAPVGLSPQSRREALLGEAVHLFAERSFASVSMEDIGASVGMAGPSVYNHFSGKHEILATALSRGTGFLQIGMSNALTSAATPMDALANLARDYAAFAVSHHDLVTLLITEVHNLPEGDRVAVMEAQRAYVAEWVHLLRDERAGLDIGSARIAVQAGLMVVNDLARTPHLQAYARIEDVASAMCLAAMGVAVD
jgi:AcrR family transcriptional regulator